MKERRRALWPTIRLLLTHRVTYRFLGLLVVALGVGQGAELSEAFGDVLCVLLGGCTE
ncbi:gp19.5 family protein [Pseudomonas sp. KCJK8993]|uniref:gp19.5 family protein n=1 Tax=Pseudomonas sp. KCJK8993 TaxID=3344565 RepID=UPI003905D210